MNLAALLDIAAWLERLGIDEFARAEHASWLFAVLVAVLVLGSFGRRKAVAWPGWVEAQLGERYVAHLGYRNVDYVVPVRGFNDYQAHIVEASIGQARAFSAWAPTISCISSWQVLQTGDPSTS